MPDRRGSGMYTLQALWTMARESLDVTTVVFANRDYAVLRPEFLIWVWVKPAPGPQVGSRSVVPISIGCGLQRARECPAPGSRG
jgi:thiamine pyrophosphate-dependent acetolactate synthase large subunit-like protein